MTVFQPNSWTPSHSASVSTKGEADGGALCTLGDKYSLSVTACCIGVGTTAFGPEGGGDGNIGGMFLLRMNLFPSVAVPVPPWVTVSAPHLLLGVGVGDCVGIISGDLDVVESVV